MVLLCNADHHALHYVYSRLRQQPHAPNRKGLLLDNVRTYTSKCKLVGLRVSQKPKQGQPTCLVTRAPAQVVIIYTNQATLSEGL